MGIAYYMKSYSIMLGTAIKRVTNKHMNKTYKDSQHYCINQLPVRHMLHHRHSQEECI